MPVDPDTLGEELEARTRRMMVEQLRAHPERTLAELAELVTDSPVGRKLGRITVGELLWGGASARARRERAPAPPRGAGRPKASPAAEGREARSRRSHEDRDERGGFDDMVLRLLEMFGPATALEMSRIVKADEAESAGALERLVERGDAVGRDDGTDDGPGRTYAVR